MNKTDLLIKADELIVTANELKELAGKEEEEIILVPDNIKISYEHWKLELHNWNQKLYYNNTYWNWLVSNAIWDMPIKCKLTPCKYEDLEAWDVFYRSDEEDEDFESPNRYAIKINDWSYQYWEENNCVNGYHTWNHYWKVQAI